jgi:hypothetical protein
MAISLEGSASAQATSIAIPSHQAGDGIIIFAGRGNTTAPTIPSGWVQLATTGANSGSSVATFKIAKTSSETSGTFTNASVLHALVFRPSAGVLFVSTALSGQATTSATISYFPLANYRAGVLDNWYVAHAFQLNSANSLETAPSGMSNLLVESSSGSWKSAVHHTGASQLSNWASTNVGPLANSAFYISRVLQLVEIDGPAYGGGGGGGGIFFRPGMSGGMSE